MAGEAFSSLMAAADQNQAQAAQKLARLQANQQSEALRRKEAELAAKERAKQEQWNKVIENHEKQVKEANRQVSPVKAPASPVKPKILQPQRSMTFKKLLKEASKVDPSTFKVGPKVKVQPRVPEKGKIGEKLKTPVPPTLSSACISSSTGKSAIQPKSPAPRPMSPIIPGAKSQKSIVERALSSSSRSVSPLIPPKSSSTTKKHLSSASSKATPSTSAVAGKSFSSKDTKSRLRDSFVPNELIPLAQGPRRDLRTIEEIQNDLWRKKGKDYPSITGQPRSIASQSRSPATSVQKVQPQKSAPPPKRRKEDEESEDSFIVSEDEEEASPELDYRAEIRAMFKRKGPSRVEYSDEDSDMEATGFEMEREERRAAQLARMEDEMEEKREEERIREKKRRKMELDKKIKGGK